MDKERIIQDELNSIVFTNKRWGDGYNEVCGKSKRLGIEITLSLYDSVDENETTIKESIEFILNKLFKSI